MAGRGVDRHAGSAAILAPSLGATAIRAGPAYCMLDLGIIGGAE
jgi:hypothetical protein